MCSALSTGAGNEILRVRIGFCGRSLLLLLGFSLIQIPRKVGPLVAIPIFQVQMRLHHNKRHFTFHLDHVEDSFHAGFFHLQRLSLQEHGQTFELVLDFGTKRPSRRSPHAPDRKPFRHVRARCADVSGDRVPRQSRERVVDSSYSRLDPWRYFIASVAQMKTLDSFFFKTLGNGFAALDILQIFADGTALFRVQIVDKKTPVKVIDLM
jgi:hypothetical protein